MPRLSVWLVRASLVYLLLGFLFGALMLAQKGIGYASPVWNLFPIHVEFLLMGWLVQLAMGVGFWIFPRFSRGLPRGDERLIWLALGLLNLGIVLAALQLWSSYAFLAGRVLEVCAALVYVAGLWRRVKPHGVL